MSDLRRYTMGIRAIEMEQRVEYVLTLDFEPIARFSDTQALIEVLLANSEHSNREGVQKTVESVTLQKSITEASLFCTTEQVRALKKAWHR